MKCKYCGNPVEEYDLFCSICGKSTQVTAGAQNQSVDSAAGNFPADKLPQKLYPPQDPVTVQPGDSTGAPTDAEGNYSPMHAYSGNAADTVQASLVGSDSPTLNKTIKERPASACAPECMTASVSSHSEPAEHTEKKQTMASEASRQHAASKKRASSRRTQRIQFCACIGVALLLGLAIGFLIKTVSNNVTEGQLKRITTEKNALDAQVADLQNELAAKEQLLMDEQSENNELSGNITELNNSISSLETQVNQYLYDKEAAERDKDTALADKSAAEEKSAELEASLEEANTSLTEAQTELSALQEEMDTLQADYDELSESSSEDKEALAFYDEHVVFVETVASDGYYHKYGCVNFSTAKFYAYSTALAKSSGYSACPVCCGGTEEPADNSTGSTGTGSGSTTSPSSIWNSLFR